jgi:hypothetical protein
MTGEARKRQMAVLECGGVLEKRAHPN